MNWENNSNSCNSPFAKLLDVAGQIYWWLLKYTKIGVVEMIFETDMVYPMGVDIKFRWSFKMADGNIVSFHKMFCSKELIQLRINDLSVVASIISKEWKKQFHNYLERGER